jgi:hypothetical protein
VNVHAFLLAAVRAERYALRYLHAEGRNITAALPELIRRDCVNAPSVLLALSLLRLSKRDDAALRRAGEALGEPSRTRKRRPPSLEALERIERYAQSMKPVYGTLTKARDGAARSAGFASGESFVRQLYAGRRKAKP